MFSMAMRLYHHRTRMDNAAIRLFPSSLHTVPPAVSPSRRRSTATGLGAALAVFGAALRAAVVVYSFGVDHWLDHLNSICEDCRMRRDDHVFCIGYEGSAAIVDGRLRARYRSHSTVQLAEAGLYKQAVASALFSGKAEELQQVLTIFNTHAKHPISSVEELVRTYGASGVPEGVTRVTVI